MMTALLLSFVVLAAPQERTLDLPVEEMVLDNGMRVLMVQRKHVPRVFCSLWWRVGSVNERTGVTGLSHFFEHMMFMGTSTIGTTDAARDAVLNDQIESIMTQIRKIKLDRLEAERRGLPVDPAGEERYKELWKQYEAAVAEQQQITVPEHLSKIFQANGGTGLNATTSYDRTNYFVELPANKVELFFWLESDRFMQPVFRSFYPEREVVKEERRMRYESTPTGLIEEAYEAMFWQAHPYRWPVIGWMSDIDQYTLKDANEYFRTHYSPQNATAIFVGDLDPKEIRSLAVRYFGRLKRFETEPDPIVTVEPLQPGERRLVSQADADNDLSVRWHGPSGVHRDTGVCDLLMQALNGRSGRLYRPLVEEKKLAVDVGAWYWSLRYGGVLNVGAQPRDGAEFGDVERELLRIVEEVREKGLTERELQKVRNQQLADVVRNLSTYNGIGRYLGYYETIGTYQDFFAYVRTLETATMEDVQRCAREYLTPEGRNILEVHRKEQKP